MLIYGSIVQGAVHVIHWFHSYICIDVCQITFSLQYGYYNEMINVNAQSLDYKWDHRCDRCYK